MMESYKVIFMKKKLMTILIRNEESILRTKKSLDISLRKKRKINENIIILYSHRK